jgi:uncharacterized membrane protein YqgA involved in biofilm formation
MIGTIVNVAGILIGGILGLVLGKPLTAGRESFFKVALGVFTVFYGLRLTCISLTWSIGPFLKQCAIILAAVTLGRLLGRLLGLQRFSNSLGRNAKEWMAKARPGGAGNVDAGFKTCAVLFCAAPLGWLGAVHEGLAGYGYVLGVKAVMDALATMSFATVFGWGVLLSAVPVLALQGTITLACTLYLKPWLEAHGVVDSVNATGGLLVAMTSLVILGLKRIELADYLPSLGVAALLSWVWR